MNEHAGREFIPQCDLGAGVAPEREQLDAAIYEVLDSGWFVLGKQVDRFEEQFAAWAGVAHCVSVANGTDALELALRALGVGAGDGVVVPGNSVSASAAAVTRVGAHPVFCDVNPRNYGLCPDHLRGLLHRDSSIKAITAVHLYGHPCDLDGVMSVSRSFNVPVIEDIAQAPGARWRDRKVGQFGVMSAYSFYPTKNLGALGDGGALTTQDASLAEEIRCLRQYGWHQRFVSDVCGVNSRLDELQAAILNVRLPQLDKNNEARRRIAAHYVEGLQGLPLTLPSTPTHTHHVYHQFVVQAEQRDELAAALFDHGIGTAIQYPVPLHEQPAYSVFATEALPVCEELAGKVLSLPMYAHLPARHVERVIDALHDILT